MTKDVVTISPATPTQEIAKLLLTHGISGVPVVDHDGVPVGMVSEGDLLGRRNGGRDARRDWWLTLLAEGEALHPDFLATLRATQLTARDVMSSPVVGITETTDAAEISRLLAQYRIKRVPVVRDGRIVGIVSRADLLHAFSTEDAAQSRSGNHLKAHGLMADFVSAIDRRFGHKADAAVAGIPHEPPPSPGESSLTIDDFRELTADSEHRKVERRENARRSAAEQRQRRVKELVDYHIADENWRSILHSAREAAARSEKEFMLLRFPSELCSDRGRAINSALAEWPATLRGEAAEIYLRWERDLQPGGFHLAARVLDFPGGVPGDIGLFLVWGQ